MTKRENFSEIRKIVENAEISAEEKQYYLAWIDREIDLLKNKSTKSNSKAKAEAAARREVVKTALAEIGQPARVSEIVAHIGEAEYSPNRVTAVLSQMCGNKKIEGTGEVVRTVEKGVAYFALAE